MQPVYQLVADEFENLKHTLSALKDSGAVASWSANQLMTWSRRPWNQDGEILPLVHYAAVRLEAKFQDFNALSKWVAECTLGIDGFEFDGVQWVLRPKRHAALVAQVQKAAMRDAVTRAQRYADAVGLGKVRPVNIADPGMLRAGQPPIVGPEAGLAFRMSSSPSGSNVELVPKGIELSAVVDARFVAG